MKGITPEDIARACRGRYVGPAGAKDQEASGITIDSRKVEEGFLFIPIKGARVDGHTFIDQVFDKGALFVLSENEPSDDSRPVVVVKSTRQAVMDIARYYRETLKIRVVGVTGSVGKTSTKEMIASVIGEKYNVLKTEGNFNNEIGLPLTIFQLREEHKVAVLEMGISHFGDMDLLADIARPDIMVITCIGECHLEHLEDRNGVLRAKTEVFKYMKESGVVILNGDDDKLVTVKEVGGKPPVFFGLGENCKVRATDIDLKGIEGTDCTIHLGRDSFTVHIGIPGRHMVYNALAAATVGKTLGMSVEEIKQGISKATAVSGRSNVIHKGNVTIIDDCYNANPQSMKAAIDLLSMVEGRKIAILGDMFELGPDELELHYNIGKYAVEKGMDYVICVGERSEYMSKGARNAAELLDFRSPNYPCKTIHMMNLDGMPDLAKGLIKDGDTVLIKASHAMGFERILDMF